MDTPDNAGSLNAKGQRVLDVDLRGRTYAEIVQWLSYAREGSFIDLVEAITVNDKSLKSTILRRWGVWR